MIFLFTDFGCKGPYLGQMEAVLRATAPGVDVVNLVSNAPSADPVASSYLLAALAATLPPASVIVAVVDPGVGGDRAPIALEADGRWFVGPDNGLFNTVALQARAVSWSIIDWRPPRLSASFHGRDLFAPIAGRIALGDCEWDRRPWRGPELSSWPADADRIVYFDFYGNAFTGRRYDACLRGKTLRVNDHGLREAATFSSVAPGEAFWYRNSLDLLELAVNGGSARERLGLVLGTPVWFVE
jgi:S-adenosylmethionine hydrolase